MEKNCRKGEHDSCYFAGTFYINPDLPEKQRNPPLAIQYLDKSCTGNHGPSCFNLAVMYNKGDKGVQKDTNLFEHYRDKTNELVKQRGSLLGNKTS